MPSVRGLLEWLVCLIAWYYGRGGAGVAPFLHPSRGPCGAGDRVWSCEPGVVCYLHASETGCLAHDG